MSEEQAIADCCPSTESEVVCDTLDFKYRLPFYPLEGDNKSKVPVEVILHFRLERCSGALVEGDPVYSTTLLPGEVANVFTSDRHSKWSYDSESKVAYHHETTSEESFLTAGIARAISDLTIVSEGEGESNFEESWASGGGGASLNLGFFSIGGGGGGGSYDAESSYEFSKSLSSHAEAASAYVAAGVRAKSSTAVGEVNRKNHAEGESEATFNVSMRSFENRNQCHAVTYMFHKLNKVQTINFRLVAIERRVDDPVAPTTARQKERVDTTGNITVVPQAVAASNPKRLEVERLARTSVIERRESQLAYLHPDRIKSVSPLNVAPSPVEPSLRKEALEITDKELASAGLLDKKTGRPSEKVIAELSWSRQELIPTPGIIVKTCLDECESCEPTRRKQISLDLERQQLENELMRRQIELLDKEPQYRCCEDKVDPVIECDDDDSEDDEWDPIS